MTASILRRCEATLGPGVTRLGAAGMAIGLAALVAGIAFGFATVSLGTLAVSWLFFAGVAAAAVAFSAAVRCSRAHWVNVVSPVAEAGAAFFPFALLLLAVLLVLAGLGRRPPPGQVGERRRGGSGVTCSHPRCCSLPAVATFAKPAPATVPTPRPRRSSTSCSMRRFCRCGRST